MCIFLKPLHLPWGSSLSRFAWCTPFGNTTSFSVFSLVKSQWYMLSFKETFFFNLNLLKTIMTPNDFIRFKNSTGVLCLRVVFKYSYLQAAYLPILKQTQNADFATCKTELNQIWFLKYSTDRKIQDSGVVHKTTFWSHHRRLEQLWTIKIYRETVYTIAHPFPFPFNAHETMIKGMSLRTLACTGKLRDLKMQQQKKSEQCPQEGCQQHSN